MKSQNLLIYILFTVIVCLVNHKTYAETRVNGNVSGDWTADGNPYIVTNNISIVHGASLSVEPGVLIEFNHGCNLTVNGLLLVEGNVQNPIIIQGTN